MFLQGWRAFAAIIILVFVFSLMAHSAALALETAVEHPELAKALAYFERGDYQRASGELTNVLEEADLSVHERHQAWEALGISHYVLGHMLDARRSFSSLLQDAPDYRPDPLYVPPEIVAFVADIKRNQMASRVTEETRPEPAPPTQGSPPSQTPDALLASQQPAMVHFSTVDLMPFGAGQFRRGWTGRGAMLATLQTLFLGSNIGLYYYRHCSLKPSCDDIHYPEEHLGQARNLQTIQIVSGSLFVATAALGILDALYLPLNSGGVTVQPLSSGVGITVPLD